MRGDGCKAPLRSRLASVSGPCWLCARWDTWTLIQSHPRQKIFISKWEICPPPQILIIMFPLPGRRSSQIAFSALLNWNPEETGHRLSETGLSVISSISGPWRPAAVKRGPGHSMFRATSLLGSGSRHPSTSRACQSRWLPCCLV